MSHNSKIKKAISLQNRLCKKEKNIWERAKKIIFGEKEEEKLNFNIVLKASQIGTH